MADQLTVEAEASWIIGAHKDVLPCFITARITDQKGDPVSGLTKSHFRIWNTGDAFGSIQPAVVIDIGQAISELPGHYSIKLDLNTSVTGQFVFILKVVRRGTGTGHSLVPVVKLK